jgi:hypothetical protein
MSRNEHVHKATVGYRASEIVLKQSAASGKTIRTCWIAVFAPSSLDLRHRFRTPIDYNVRHAGRD